MKINRKFAVSALAPLLVLSLLAGCSSAKKDVISASATPSGTYGSGVIGAAPKAEISAGDSSTSSVTTSEAFASADSAKLDTSGIIIAPEPMPGEIELPGGIGVEPQAGMLTAGTWNDNENFDFFCEVLARDEWLELCGVWHIDPTSRISIHVTDPNTQSPVKGAAVKLFESDNELFSAVTDANGNAYLYYNLKGGNAVPDRVVAQYGIHSNENMLSAGETDVELFCSEFENVTLSSGKALDLMFVVDTTGSMGDELEFLKEELRDVISRVANDNSGMRIRLSVNFYRDDGDEYIVKYFSFTEDIDQALSDLRKQSSAGGGDTPEAVHTAFDNAVNGHEWSEDSVKLMFFVLDAPPHADQQGVPESISDSIAKAASLGIRVIPVVSSGADTETELVMRTAAAVTGGAYTFLTDDSGIGYSHLEPTIGNYQVEALNALMIRLINEYCA